MVVILRCRKGKTTFQHAFDTFSSTVSGTLTQYVFLILTIKDSYSMLIIDILLVFCSMITMDQLLESLINKAKNESQDAHRLLLCALNGMSNVYYHCKRTVKCVFKSYFLKISFQVLLEHTSYKRA